LSFVATPEVDPFKRTDTLGIGAPWSSVTVPVTDFCCAAATSAKAQKIGQSKSFKTIFVIAFVFVINESDLCFLLKKKFIIS